MFALLGKTMGLAISLAIEGERPQGNPHVTQEQDDIGPLMTDDIPFAVMERFGVFRVQTRSVLQRPVDDEQLPLSSRLRGYPETGVGTRVDLLDS
jgi:hypothetical protein